MTLQKVSRFTATLTRLALIWLESVSDCCSWVEAVDRTSTRCEMLLMLKFHQYMILSMFPAVVPVLLGTFRHLSRPSHSV